MIIKNSKESWSEILGPIVKSTKRNMQGSIGCDHRVYLDKCHLMRELEDEVRLMKLESAFSRRNESNPV